MEDENMTKNRKGPKQQEQPDLPKSAQQPYGEPLAGSHKVKKIKIIPVKKNDASHDM